MFSCVYTARFAFSDQRLGVLFLQVRGLSQLGLSLTGTFDFWVRRGTREKTAFFWITKEKLGFFGVESQTGLFPRRRPEK